MHDTILILDFGSQVTQLIARRIREAHVYCEVHPCDVSDAWLLDYVRRKELKGVILSGSHASVNDEAQDRAPESVFTLGVPVLGICYGMQTMAHQLGGEVSSVSHREFGFAALNVSPYAPLLSGLSRGESLQVWMSHGDQVQHLPTGFSVIAKTASCAVAAMADTSRHFYGLQFHPEVTHTEQGAKILQRFVLDICRVKPDWIMKNHIPEAIKTIQEQVGSDHVILGLSGGVDSSVAAALIHRAIGQQLTCIFVDHGLLRQNEGDQVMTMFEGRLHAKVVRVNAQDRFFLALKGVTDPEVKRKIIGRLFVEVFQEEAEKLKAAGQATPQWLAQGTIYPDVIESGGAKSKKAVTIKSHHNVGGLPETLGLKLLEPLRDLFKDEVRELGLALDLDDALIYRHPFPGPGLGVRILGEVKPEYADILRAADDIFIQTLKTNRDSETGKTWYEQTSQAFAVFLPVKSVGVMGDGRTYEYVVALRAVQTSDFMTADWAELPPKVLKQASSRIINEVRGVNRVTYDISSKPPATIEWE